MHVPSQHIVRPALIFFGGLTVSALLYAATAVTQGIAVTTKSTPTTVTTDVNALKRRIDELERRVVELEKEALDSPDQEEETPLYKRIEGRLAALETDQQKEDAADKVANESGGKSEDGLDPLNVVAPFVVRDDDGKVLMRVERTPQGNARLIVGNPIGSAAVLTATPTGAVMQLVDSTNAVRFAASGMAGKGTAGARTVTSTGSMWIGEDGDGAAVLQILNKSQVTVAELRGMVSQAGQLTISNAVGEKVVVAGVATNGVGVVKTGPGGLGPAATLGNIALPASEIQGRKR